MYNLIECNNNYTKASESLWQLYRDIPDEADNAAIKDFESFKSK